MGGGGMGVSGSTGGGRRGCHLYQAFLFCSHLSSSRVRVERSLNGEERSCGGKDDP